MDSYDPKYVTQKNYVLVGMKAVVRNSKGQILILKRSSKTRGGGGWSIPGGYLEDKEDPYRGIIREVKEETGLKVVKPVAYTVKKYLGRGDFTVVIGFQCRTNNSSVRLNWEHDEYKWVSKKTALEKYLSPFAGLFVKEI